MPEEPKYPCATKDRCTGHCCERFFIARDPSSFRAAYLAHLEGKPVDPNAVFAHMFFVPIENSDGVKMDDLTPSDAEKLKRGAYYSCRHFDTVKRECSIYERRPDICKWYGTTTSPCAHRACTWKDAYRTNYKSAGETKNKLSEATPEKFTLTPEVLNEAIRELVHTE